MLEKISDEVRFVYQKLTHSLLRIIDKFEMFKNLYQTGIGEGYIL